MPIDPMPTHTMHTNAMPVEVRPLRETDLPEADRIFRLAFGTFLGMPDPRVPIAS